MEMSLRFGRAGRKSSTPFFPGAWPSTPAHENRSETSMGHAECNEASEKSRQIMRQPSQSDTVDPTHLDHVVDFHKRISKSLAVFTRPRHPSDTGGSAAGSSSTQSPPMSPVLSDVSTIPSEGIQTPEDHPLCFSLNHSLPSQANSDNFNQPPNRPPRNPNRSTSLHRPKAVTTERRLSAIQLDSPLTNLSPNLHHLDTPAHEFAFSRMSTNPYFASGNDSGISTSDIDSPEAPSYSSSLSSLAFAETVHNHSTTIPEFTITPPVGGETAPATSNNLATSHSSSSLGFGTDSPVLPSEDGLSPVSAFRAHRYHSPGSHRLSPSSADMDAFGIAASNHEFSDSDSMLSIPTSFQSASAQGSISADDTARGHATRQSSVSLSLSLELSSDGPQASTSNSRPKYDDAVPPFFAYNPDAKVPSKAVTCEITAPPKEKKGPSKASRFVKNLGTRIKKLFKSKPESEARSGDDKTVYGVDVTTMTNTVDYTSEHPIPRKGSPSRRFGAPNLPPKSRTSPLLKFARRRSMPAGTASMPDVSQPRPLRPTSFLPMDGRNVGSSRHLVAMPSVIGIKPPTDPQSKKRQQRHSTIYTGYQQLSRPASKIRIDATLSSIRRRTRTQTAPANHRGDSSTDPRRSSVASSIGEVIRTTVSPHPPLPKPTRQGTFGLEHRRSASTSARDAWNAAKPAQERDLDSPVDPVDISIPNSPQENIHGPVMQPPLEELSISEENHAPVDPDDAIQSSYEKLTRTTSPTSDHGGRTRSHTQSTVRPNEQPEEKSKRRSRGFSLSSAISKRAFKARSFIAGRSNEPVLPALPSEESRGHGATASVSGVSFDMVTSSGKSIHSPKDDTTSGCAEYDPDIVLDRMSFATTPGPPSTVASSMDLSISPAPSEAYPEVTPNEVYFTAQSAPSTTDDESSVEENEDSREFTRALGLEFDAIVNRARNE